MVLLLVSGVAWLVFSISPPAVVGAPAAALSQLVPDEESGQPTPPEFFQRSFPLSPLPVPPATPGEQPAGPPPSAVAGPYSVAPRPFSLFPTGPPPGWYVLPSLGLGALLDDNIDNASSKKRSDFITRVAPGVALGFSSPRVNFQFGGSTTADIYAVYSENTRPFSSQTVSLSSAYQLTPAVKLGLNADYSRTDSTTSITNELGARVGSGVAQTYSVAPSLAYQFAPRTAIGLGYRLLRNQLSGGPSNDEHSASLSLSHRFSPADMGLLDYKFELFEDDGTTRSHVLTAGWSRQLGPNTVASVGIGPRFTDDDQDTADVDAAVDFAHRFKYGTLALSYTRTQSIATGMEGIQDVDSVSAGFAFPPLWRGYLVSISANFTRSDPATQAGEETRSYGLGARVSRQLTSWLTADVFYRFTYEDGASDRTRNVVGIELTASRLYPLR